ncbi:ArsR family transcriptional regulator [Brevibacillus ruminantium]|uniref:ArsR family transcriptional regulator n=1 Tax=Brevibacillus ruminantium TaxID=2950604 RepID=A0ABY4WBC7_9BACL|nr:ArsR family transcriptional regulator [Brevibacillus ruminantium]USG64490.1 ArsR family transcriptional regulator [Brevibacillus ruminantium]
MKLRLGLLGADDTLELIRSVVCHYPEIEPLPIVYHDEEEIVKLLEPHVDEAHMWLFSGQVPYAMAKEWGKIQKPMAYIPHTGASLYRTLLHIVHEEQLKISELSFDTIPLEEFAQMLEESGIAKTAIWLKSYEGAIRASELADFHEQLWREGKTRAAVTCLRTAELECKRRGVPVYRVLPTRAGIESILSMLLRTHEMLLFKDSQIAVQLIELDSLTGMTSETFSTDELYQLEQESTERLQRYAKQIQGSLKTTGPGRYVIYTTRGILGDFTKGFTTAPHFSELLGIKDELVISGIGIGKTAYEAEIHAGTALLHAKRSGPGAWMVFFDDKQIAGPLGKSEQITFSGASDQLQEVSRLTSLSVQTLSKLQSILKKRGSSEINAHELAMHMQILPRSARRILIELESKGIARVVGEDNPHPRGRPRKVYRITL